MSDPTPPTRWIDNDPHTPPARTARWLGHLPDDILAGWLGSDLPSVRQAAADEAAARIREQVPGPVPAQALGSLLAIDGTGRGAPDMGDITKDTLLDWAEVNAPYPAEYRARAIAELVRRGFLDPVALIPPVPAPGALTPDQMGEALRVVADRFAGTRIGAEAAAMVAEADATVLGVAFVPVDEGPVVERVHHRIDPTAVRPDAVGAAVVHPRPVPDAALRAAATADLSPDPLVRLDTSPSDTTSAWAPGAGAPPGSVDDLPSPGPADPAMEAGFTALAGEPVPVDDLPLMGTFTVDQVEAITADEVARGHAAPGDSFASIARGRAHRLQAQRADTEVRTGVARSTRAALVEHEGGFLDALVGEWGIAGTITRLLRMVPHDQRGDVVHAARHAAIDGPAAPLPPGVLLGQPVRAEVVDQWPGADPTRDPVLSVATNAAGFAMFAGTRASYPGINGVETIELNAAETERSERVAAAVLDHVAHYRDALGPLAAEVRVPHPATGSRLLLLDLWLALGGTDAGFEAWITADDEFADRWPQLTAAVAGDVALLAGDTNPPAGADLLTLAERRARLHTPPTTAAAAPAGPPVEPLDPGIAASCSAQVFAFLRALTAVDGVPDVPAEVRVQLAALRLHGFVDEVLACNVPGDIVKPPPVLDEAGAQVAAGHRAEAGHLVPDDDDPAESIDLAEVPDPVDGEPEPQP